MARYYTRPQPVDAFQWHPDQGIPAGLHGKGCAICYPRMCMSEGHHQPIAHPHHLELETPRGVEVVWPGSWLVTYGDGTRTAYASDAFAERFSATPYVPYAGSAAARYTVEAAETARKVNVAADVADVQVPE